MSQYTKFVQKHGKNYRVVYGFDRPLTEYFIQVWDSADEDCPVFAVSNYCTLDPHPEAPDKFRYTNSELLPLFLEWEVPEEHIHCLVLDLPIPESVAA